MIYFELLKLAAPEAILVLTALAVLVAGLTSERRAVAAAVSAAPPAASLSKFLAFVGMVLSAAAILKLPQNANLFGGMLVVSPLNSLFKIVCLTLAAATVLLSPSGNRWQNRGEYLAIILLATLGLMLLVGSEELLMIFIGLELLGLSLYILTAFDKTDIRSAEAGLKYFLFGSTASAFTLFGISLIYGISGTTSLAGVAAKITAIQPLLAVGLVMTLVGFAFKIAAAPFHLWAPDTYQAAPVSSAGFIASGSKVASFVVLGKIVLIGFGSVRGSAMWHGAAAGWSPLLAFLAALSILLGNFAALVQTNVRRLLAYSAVAHAGYTLLGLIAGGRDGFSATLFYTTIYAITLVGAFGVCGAVRDQTGGDDLKNFAGLRLRSPFLAACMSIFLLSLAGIPPLAGFFGKFYLFSVALRAGGEHGLVWLVVIALFGSFVSLYYYLIVLKTILVDRTAIDTAAGHIGIAPRGVLFVTAAAIVLLGVVPTPLVNQILASLP